MCDIAGMPELAGAMIRDGLTLDEAKSAILDAKAKAAEKAPIISTVGPLATGEINPLLADAKKRAEKQVTVTGEQITKTSDCTRTGNCFLLI